MLKVENWYTFEERIKDFSEIDRWNTHSAYWFAKYGHRGQNRQGGEAVRYFEHVREVALIILDELQLDDPVLVQAALLHDVLEDTGVLGNPIRLSREDWEKETKYRLVVNFGDEVAEIVRSLTHIGSVEDYYSQLNNASDKALVVKMCDTLHNIRSMSDLPKTKIRRKLSEYQSQYLPIFRKLLSSTEYDLIYRYILAEMNLEIEKLNGSLV